MRFVGNLPDRTNSKNQRFNWVSSESATFKCSIDSPDFTPCGSGSRGSKRLSNLDDGSHTFRVQAMDKHGNQGPVAQRTWKIGKVLWLTTRSKYR